MTIDIRDITFSYADETVLDDLNLAVPNGRITALVGPNGSGKSTLLHVISRILAPRTGIVLVDGRNIHQMRTREAARQLSILPQMPEAPDGLTVEDLVAYGRFAWQRPLMPLGQRDKDQIALAIELSGMTHLAKRRLSELSGGQRQRAWIAMALAQDSAVMLLDEPTTFLDIAHQFEVLSLLRKLNSENAKTIMVVLHDLNQAAAFSDDLVILKAGTILGYGPCENVLTAEIISEAFGINVDFAIDPKTGRKIIIPRSVIA